MAVPLKYLPSLKRPIHLLVRLSSDQDDSGTEYVQAAVITLDRALARHITRSHQLCRRHRHIDEIRIAVGLHAVGQDTLFRTPAPGREDDDPDTVWDEWMDALDDGDARELSAAEAAWVKGTAPVYGVRGEALVVDRYGPPRVACYVKYPHEPFSSPSIRALARWRLEE